MLAAVAPRYRARGEKAEIGLNDNYLNFWTFPIIFMGFRLFWGDFQRNLSLFVTLKRKLNRYSSEGIPERTLFAWVCIFCVFPNGFNLTVSDFQEKYEKIWYTFCLALLFQIPQTRTQELFRWVGYWPDWETPVSPSTPVLIGNYAWIDPFLYRSSSLQLNNPKFENDSPKWHQIHTVSKC